MSMFIAYLAKRLGLSDLAAWVGVALVALGLAGVSWGLHEWRVEAALSAARTAGAATERAAWESSVSEERRRQAAINDRASESALHEQARLRAERDELARQLEDLAHAADQDPDRDRISLPARGVRRIDQIR